MFSYTNGLVTCSIRNKLDLFRQITLGLLLMEITIRKLRYEQPRNRLFGQIFAHEMWLPFWWTWPTNGKLKKAFTFNKQATQLRLSAKISPNQQLAILNF